MRRYNRYRRPRIKPRKSCWREGCDKGWIIEKRENGQLKARRCECLLADMKMERDMKNKKNEDKNRGVL